MVLTLTTSHVECPAMLPDSGAMTAMLGQATGRRTRVSNRTCGTTQSGWDSIDSWKVTYGRELGAEAGVPMAVRPMLAGIRQVGR